MNVQKRDLDLIERRARAEKYCTVTYMLAERPWPWHPEDIAHLKAQVMARTDGESRIAFVETLQAQVKASTYPIDSQVLAQLLQEVSGAHALLGLGAEDGCSDEQDKAHQ